MVAPNSLVRQKDGTQGEEDQQELRHQLRTIPQAQLGQGCRIRGTGENMDGGVGFHSTERVEGARDR